MGRREATNKPRYKVDSCPFSFQARSSMASPYLSERVCAAILRSLCVDEGKMHGEAVVSCLRKQRLVINIAGEEAVFSFADAVDETNYDARGMIDDFFPRYPYKTTRNSWRFFKVWLNDGTGQLYKEFCEEWIDLAQKFLRECSSCRACARKPTTEKLMQVFGTVRPYYIGERPRRMYHNDDQMMLSSELYPVAGGLVAEGNLPEVKEEVWDAPPGFAYPLIRREVGGPSGEKRVPVARAQQKIQSDRDDEPAMEGRVVVGDQSRIDPMLVDPAVMLLHELSGATHL